MDLLQLPRLDLLGPEQGDKTKERHGLSTEFEGRTAGSYSRPEVSSPPVPVLAGRCFLLKNSLYTLADCSERFLEDRNLVFSRHVATRKLQVFLRMMCQT